MPETVITAIAERGRERTRGTKSQSTGNANTATTAVKTIKTAVSLSWKYLSTRYLSMWVEMAQESGPRMANSNQRIARMLHTHRARQSGRDYPRESASTRWGVIGNVVTPNGKPNASSMADAIAAPTAVTPASPAPLMPSALSGLGASSVKRISTADTSHAVGMR